MVDIPSRDMIQSDKRSRRALCVVYMSVVHEIFVWDHLLFSYSLLMLKMLLLWRICKKSRKGQFFVKSISQQCLKKKTLFLLGQEEPLETGMLEEALRDFNSNENSNSNSKKKPCYYCDKAGHFETGYRIKARASNARGRGRGMLLYFLLIPTLDLPISLVITKMVRSIFSWHKNHIPMRMFGSWIWEHHHTWHQGRIGSLQSRKGTTKAS